MEPLLRRMETYRATSADRERLVFLAGHFGESRSAVIRRLLRQEYSRLANAGITPGNRRDTRQVTRRARTLDFPGP